MSFTALLTSLTGRKLRNKTYKQCIKIITLPHSVFTQHVHAQQGLSVTYTTVLHESAVWRDISRVHVILSRAESELKYSTQAPFAQRLFISCAAGVTQDLAFAFDKNISPLTEQFQAVDPRRKWRKYYSHSSMAYIEQTTSKC